MSRSQLTPPSFGQSPGLQTPTALSLQCLRCKKSKWAVVGVAMAAAKDALHKKAQVLPFLSHVLYRTGCYRCKTPCRSQQFVFIRACAEALVQQNSLVELYGRVT